MELSRLIYGLIETLSASIHVAMIWRKRSPNLVNDISHVLYQNLPWLPASYFLPAEQKALLAHTETESDRGAIHLLYTTCPSPSTHNW